MNFNQTRATHGGETCVFADRKQNFGERRPDIEDSRPTRSGNIYVSESHQEANSNVVRCGLASNVERC